jgi:hypothetical protein
LVATLEDVDFAVAEFALVDPFDLVPFAIKLFLV